MSRREDTYQSCLIKQINQPNYLSHFLQSNSRSNRQAQLRISESLSYRKAQLRSIPSLFSITLLLVRSNRIMTYSPHTILLQIIMQTITILLTINNDWEEMICILLIREKIWKSNQWIIDMLIIIMSNLFSMLIIFSQILQLHIKHGCLNLIQARITTGILEHILLLTSIICKSAHTSCKLWIICSNCATITKCTKILTRVERVTCCITYVTSHTSICMLTSMTLCTIFYQLQIVLLTDLTNLISICQTAIKVNNCNSLSLRSDGSLNQVIINLKGIRLRLYKYRHKIILSNCKNSSNICISRHDDFISRLHDPHLNVRTENPYKSI